MCFKVFLLVLFTDIFISLSISNVMEDGSLSSCSVYVLGELTPKVMETKKNSEWSLSRIPWLSLFKKPPVWYSL